LNSPRFISVVAASMLLIVLVSIAANKLMPGHAGGHVLLYLVVIGAVIFVIRTGLNISKESEHDVREVLVASMSAREAMSTEDFSSAFPHDDVALALRIRELLSNYLGIPADRFRPTDMMLADLLLGSLNPQLTCHVLLELYPGWAGRWVNAEWPGEDISLRDWVLRLKAWRPEPQEADKVAPLWLDKRDRRI
jgi:hypothetical protein